MISSRVREIPADEEEIDMTLPSLSNWETTRDALHQITQIVGAVRVACADPLPNDLHYSVDVTAAGISSTRMRCGGELNFDFAALQLAFVRGGKTVFTLDAHGLSQTSLMQRLLAIFGDCGYSIDPSLKHITNETEFNVDRELAINYLQVLDAVFTALARFRGKLSGFLTPLVVWPHHFDLAFIWFPSDRTDEHSAPQIAFGFAPFSSGLDRPYVYAYAWSEPTGYVQVPLDAPAQAVSEGYTGLYASYDALHGCVDFNTTVETMLREYQRLVIPQLS